MSDQYQIMSIVAAAIRSCRSEMSGDHGPTEIGTEEMNFIAKAIIRSLADSGLLIVEMPKADVVVDDRSFT